ncbi:hypothetical protein KJ786_03640 [Patescibacteria group bacterium]|nr:hypothetical protein [Patescibacteria group bacterium]
MSNLKQKILLLLLGGLAFGYSYTPQRQWRVIKGIAKEWKKIENKGLPKEVGALHRAKLVERKQKADGTFTFILTKKGKLKALTYHFQEMRIKKQTWDGKWRLVVFDIPEKIKKGRDALRHKIKKAWFL